MDYTTIKMKPGYADTSTRRYPKQPETTVVTDSDCDACNCVGQWWPYGAEDWIAFRNPKTRRYYFQTKVSLGIA